MKIVTKLPILKGLVFVVESVNSVLVLIVGYVDPAVPDHY